MQIEGAQPGDILKVEVLKVEPRVPYGVISSRHGKGALVGEFPKKQSKKMHRLSILNVMEMYRFSLQLKNAKGEYEGVLKQNLVNQYVFRCILYGNYGGSSQYV